MTIDKLSFFCRDLMQVETVIPMVGNSIKYPPNVNIGLYPSLIGTFSMPLPKVNMISHVYNEPSVMEVPFKTSYLSDPWNLPNPNDETLTSMAMPLSIVEVT